MKQANAPQFDFEIRNTVQQNELELFKKILESVSEGIVIANSKTGFLLYANSSFCKLFNYKPSEIPRVHFSLLHPDDFLARAQTEFTTANRTNKAVLNVPCIKKNGTLFYVDLYDRRILFQDEECNLATFVDITRRYTIEQTLRENEEKIIKTSRDADEANERAAISDGIFNQFLLHSPALIYFKDEKIRAVKLSKNFEKLLGIPLEQMIGKSNYDLFPSEFAQKMVEDDLKILEGNETIEIEEEFNNNYYTTVKFPIQITKNSRGLAGFSIDITDRKNAEQALKESEEKYKRLFNEDLTGNYIISPNGIITDCNKSFVQILGFISESEMIGQKIQAILTSKSEFDSIINLLKKQKQLINVESVRKNKEGKLLNVIENMVANFDSSGEITEIRGYILDITDRKKAEDRQNFFGKILEILNKAGDIHELIHKIVKEIKSFTKFNAVGIRLESGHDFPYYAQDGFSYDFIKEENFICARFNDGSIKTDSLGKPIHECICGLVISGKGNKNRPYVTKNGSIWINYSRDIIGITPNNDDRTNPRNTCIHYGYMTILLIPVKAREKIIGLLQLNDKEPYRLTPDFISFFEEIAATIGIAYSRIENELKLKRAKEKAELSELNLQQLNSTKDKLFSVIAHDLINPFNTILGYSKLLKENINNHNTEKLENLSDTINLSAQGTLTLLENLLNWAKAQTGQLVFNPKLLNLKNIINEIFIVLIPSASIKNISLNYFLSTEIHVFADKEMLMVILRNIVTNAIKFTNYGGKISIYGIEIQNTVEVTISDNGIGISDEIKSKLFSLENSITTAGTAKEKGSGLGLVLCKDFVEKHGGRIWVESQVGKGSDFKFTIPATDDLLEKNATV
jgi:PAS domain S-box-containing protein